MHVFHIGLLLVHNYCVMNFLILSLFIKKHKTELMMIGKDYHRCLVKQAGISRLHLLLAYMSKVCGRAAWKTPWVECVMEQKFFHFPDRKRLERYISEDITEQHTQDLLCSPDQESIWMALRKMEISAQATGLWHQQSCTLFYIYLHLAPHVKRVKGALPERIE